MKLSLCILLFVFGLCYHLNADDIVIKPGQNVVRVAEQMAAAKYQRTYLQILSANPDTDLLFWSVEPGILIVSYSTKSKNVAGLSFLLNYEGENKAEKARDNISINVIEFAPFTGEMKLKLPEKKEAADDFVIKPNQNIDEVSKQMSAAKFEGTGLQVVSSLPDSTLAFRIVKPGVLIVAYSTASKKVTGLTFLLHYEGKKEDKKPVSLDVTEFAPLTGEMKIKLPKKEEADKGNK